MSFVAMALKNILGRPGRSLLTALGVAIGIAAVIVLLTLASGFERSWADSYNARGADLMVGKFTTHRPLPTPFPASICSELRKLPLVESGAGVLTDLISIEDAAPLIVMGWETHSFLWNHVTLIEGHFPASDDERTVALGTIASELLGKSVGDTVQIESLEYRVCGRFTSSALTESGAILMTLHQLQEATAREGLVNFVTLKLKPGGGSGAADQVRAQVRERLKGYGAYTTGEVIQNNITIQAAKAMSMATSLVALVIGAIGILNTVLMSVMERIREIAVLLAVGWHRLRVLGMILLESILLSIAGGLMGIGFGLIALQALQMAPWLRGKIETDPSGTLLLWALFISVGMGTLGGLYPAWKSAHLPVIKGLHHE
jgi:putative ABC transport system permease protein